MDLFNRAFEIDKNYAFKFNIDSSNEDGSFNQLLGYEQEKRNTIYIRDEIFFNR
jgi:hypothetical protein